jgi:hypothetical protein
MAIIDTEMMLSSGSLIKNFIIRVLLNISGKSKVFKIKVSFSLFGNSHFQKRHQRLKIKTSSHQSLKIKTSSHQGLKIKISGFKKVLKPQQF